MGQYYTLVLLNIESHEYHRYKPVDGFKLMEFAYYYDNMANLLSSEIYHKPKRVLVLGDYAKESEFKDKRYQEMFNFKKLMELPEETEVYAKFDYTDKYIVNLSKGEYIKLGNPDSNKLTIFEPLLLCALGNGKGGGDYYGINSELVGSWAGDILVIINEEEFNENYSASSKALEVSFEEVW